MHVRTLLFSADSGSDQRKVPQHQRIHYTFNKSLGPAIAAACFPYQTTTLIATAHYKKKNGAVLPRLPKPKLVKRSNPSGIYSI
jgi:hypothetical protein